jgi:hypothetical protein
MPNVKTSCQASGLKNQVPGSGQLGSASPTIRATAYMASDTPSASQGLTRTIANTAGAQSRSMTYNGRMLQ